MYSTSGRCSPPPGQRLRYPKVPSKKLMSGVRPTYQDALGKCPSAVGIGGEVSWETLTWGFTFVQVRELFKCARAQQKLA